MTEPLDVALIGAGPYSLSISAHLTAANIDHQVFGTPMESWRRHMPAGMMLKSYGESSNLADPRGTFTLEAFSRQAGIPYHPSQVPVSRESFIDYGCSFQKHFVSQIAERRLVEHAVRGRLHELRFDNGEVVSAKNVVMAIGAVPFASLPSAFDHLPRELVSHSSAYGPLEHLRGREVTIVGGGSSALDIAALLSDLGGKVTLLLRGPAVRFQSPPPTRQSLLHRLLAPDANGLGDGWLLRLCANHPEVIHRLPDRARRAIVANTLGPVGGYFVKNPVTSKVAVLTGRKIVSVADSNGRARVTTIDSQNRTGIVDSDHVIAATGYRVDLHQLAFLSADVLGRLRVVDDIPILSSSFESSVPGLFFVGLTSARSFGPVMRFLVGAPYSAHRLTKALCQRLPRRSIVVPVLGSASAS